MPRSDRSDRTGGALGDLVPIPRSLLEDDAPAVAPTLLGSILVAGECAGRIVEVEAYTADDPASHSVRGRTPRNASMFEAAGTLYVYFTYGMHHCANVVTGSPGDGQAVLIRAVEPLLGLERMRARRPGRGDRELTNGPAKLCQAFDIDRRLDGTDLCDPASVVWLARPTAAVTRPAIVSTRIGIREGTDRPWRWVSSE
jgi:DNA-3-methyladenine glycosylase